MTDEAQDAVTVLTPPGAAAIAVVRLHGPRVAAFVARFCSGKPAPGRAVHLRLIDENARVIDDPVVVLHGDGLTLDINLHGGPWVVRECLSLAQRFGFTEASDRHPDAHSDVEREMLESLPLARTEQAIRMLLAQPQAWAALTQELSLLPGPDVQRRARSILEDRSLWWMLHPPRIAIVGQPNVGKSTLANQLFGQARSITADVPGTTRDWVGDWANIDGLPVMLLDTPGQRESADPIEQAAIARSREQIEQADLLILMLDATRPLPRELVARYPNSIRVVNKCDLPAAWDIHAIDAIHTVATTGQGIEQVRSRILAHFGCEKLDPSIPRCWTDRQRQILHHAQFQNIREMS
ncbi:GTPase [Fontivita pretiosa]|uniref:GTPase n=1 Tax=Fontivita pretiosa TaxID=2989684 RepID=UPI003D167F89